MSRGVLLAAGLAVLVLARGIVIGHQLLAPLPELQDQILVEACMASIPEPEESGWRVDARVRFLRHPQWPARRLRLQLPEGLPAPVVGDCWQYAVRPGQPQDVAGRRALLRNHLSGYARVDAGPLNQRLGQGGRGIAALRARLALRISDQVSDPAAAALLAALAVGATGDLTARQWQVFNATGITHLVAISGMHVTFFALMAMWVARRVWNRMAPRRWLPRRSAFAAAVGSSLALIYALLSGFSIPAQRTVLMLVVFLGLREFARSAPPGRSIAAALGAVLLLDPMAVFSAGFWLSFAAVAAIMLFVGERLQPPAPLRGALQLQWAVSITLLPVTVAIFGAFSAGGVLVNLVAIPVFSILLVPPVLLATAFLLLPGEVPAWCAGALIQLAGWVAARSWPGLEWCANLPAVLWHARPPWTWYLIAGPAVLCTLLPLAPRMRLAAAALLGSIFLLRAPRPPHGEMWIDVQGRGAAAAVMLRTRSHLLLLGTGETYGSAGRRFVRYVLPDLRAAGHERIDLWLPGTLTRDVQNALGLAAAEIPVYAVMLPPARPAPPEFSSCTTVSWRWDGIEFGLRAAGTGRECVLTAIRGEHRIELVGADAAALAGSAARGARLVLDDSGLAMRSALIGL